MNENCIYSGTDKMLGDSRLELLTIVIHLTSRPFDFHPFGLLKEVPKWVSSIWHEGRLGIIRKCLRASGGAYFESYRSIKSSYCPES